MSTCVFPNIPVRDKLKPRYARMKAITEGLRDSELASIEILKTHPSIRIRAQAFLRGYLFYDQPSY